MRRGQDGAVMVSPVDRTELGLERRDGRARLPGRSTDVPDSLGLAASTVGTVVGGIVVGDVVHVALDDEHGGGDGLSKEKGSRKARGERCRR